MADTRLRITGIAPALAVPGGEVTIHCEGFVPGLPCDSKVLFGTIEASISSASEDRIVVRVPDSPQALGVALRVGDAVSPLFPFQSARQVAKGLHPVTSPAVASDGSVITTISGSRGEKMEHPLVRIERSGEVVPLQCEIMNPTGVAFGPGGRLYVSSRNDGVVLRMGGDGQFEPVADDLGIACGIAFDSSGTLHVGDRSGTIYRVDAGGRKTELARLEPSVSAYHLTFDRADNLYVTGPTFSTRDALYRIPPDGSVETVVTGIARPQGMALDDVTLLVTAAFGGRKGVFRLSGSGALEHFIAGPTLVGVAAAPDRALYLADNSSVYRLERRRA